MGSSHSLAEEPSLTNLDAENHTSDGTDDVLYPHHRVLLEVESAIAQVVIESRGYRTMVNPQELLDLDFKPYQTMAPGLLVPLHDPYGRVSSYQYRPDEPRKVDNGKGVKYETHAGYRQVLDANPILGERLRDPGEPLIVTAAARKADAASNLRHRGMAVLPIPPLQERHRKSGKRRTRNLSSLPNCAEHYELRFRILLTEGGTLGFG